MSQATLPGFSDAADYLTKTEQELNDRQRESVTFSRQTAIDAIWEVWLPCKEPNWDGENAIAISETTFENAYRLIDALPHGFPSPTVTAEPDGHLNLEWYKNPRRILSVSVSPRSLLHWAALIGSEDPRGSCRFFDEVPKSLRYYIGRVFAG